MNFQDMANGVLSGELNALSVYVDLKRFQAELEKHMEARRMTK